MWRSAGDEHVESNVAAFHGAMRALPRGRWAADLATDLRFALRHFARHRLAAATIVAVLALGIGANTAYVSVVQAWFVRPAPAVPRDDAHVRIHGLEQSSPGARWRRRAFSYDELRALGERTGTFAGVAGWTGHDVVLDAGDGAGARGVGAEFVTPNFFRVLGVPLAAGPGLVQGEPGEPDMAAVVAFALAEELHGSAAAAVGKVLAVNGVPVRIAGVAPPRFQGALPNGERPVLWLPVSARSEIARVSPRWLDEGGALYLFARLAPGVRAEQATADARQVAGRLLPDSAARAGTTRGAEVRAMRAAPPLSDDDDLVPFAAFAVIGLLFLLIACTNVSSLMVAAAAGRRQEIAVRRSLGASRGRLVRQLLTESTLLAGAGAAIGLLLYWLFVVGVARRDPEMQLLDLVPDLGTLAATLLLALGTGILVGLSPALHATRAGVAGSLRDSGAGATHRSRLQRGLVVAQIVLSQPLLLVLAVAVSEVWSWHAPLPRSLSERVVSAGFRPLTRTGGPGQRQEAVDSLIPRIARHPDVVAVVPEPHTIDERGIAVPAPADSAAVPSRIHLEGAAPGWFALLDVPVLLGRDVSLADSAGADSADVAVVIGSDLARALWGDANPLGRTVPSPARPGAGQDSAGLRVVGVYDAARAPSRGNSPGAAPVYTAHGLAWRRDALLIRTRGTAVSLLPELRRLIRAEAPGVPLGRLETLAHTDAAERRATLGLAAGVGGAGGLALLLASLGLYGVVSLAVRQRTREIGIRIAIGAEPSGVARMFLASGMRMAAAALALGMPVSLAALYLSIAQGVVVLSGLDVWLVGACVAIVLLAVASAATWLPARRAALVDPAATLRE